MQASKFHRAIVFYIKGSVIGGAIGGFIHGITYSYPMISEEGKEVYGPQGWNRFTHILDQTCKGAVIGPFFFLFIPFVMKKILE